MSSENSMIEAKNILVKYGNVIALDSFSAEIPSGIVGILGPNGAGKTTLIKVILGLIKPDRGELLFEGVNIQENLSSIRDMVGYMPEDECLIGDMDAFELVSYFGRMSGMLLNDSVKRSHEVLDFVGIEEERYRDIESFSTGMKQRVKLAQAIIHDPQILLLDEPTNGMDPEGKGEMLSLISKIGKSGKTVLVSSHLLHEIEKIAEHVVIIRDGKLIKSGSLNEILRPEEYRFKIKIRGDSDRISKFKEMIDDNYEIIEASDEGGQESIIIRGVKRSGPIFDLINKLELQVRYYRPDILTLENVFIEAFQGGG
ncbi:MAG: ABC transporter ATP-binding protein [Thermoplasmatota archaeon]